MAKKTKAELVKEVQKFNPNVNPDEETKDSLKKMIDEHQKKNDGGTPSVTFGCDEQGFCDLANKYCIACQTEHSEGFTICQKQTAEKARNRQERAANKKERKPSFRLAREQNNFELLQTIIQRVDTPTNFVDLCLLEGGEPEAIVKKIKEKYEGTDYKDMRTVSKILAHVRFRESNNGWKFEKKDGGHKYVRLIGLTPLPA